MRPTFDVGQGGPCAESNEVTRLPLLDSTILERYAPLVSFHPNERYFPCSVEWLLAHACLRHTRNSLCIWQPTQADLLQHWRAYHSEGSTPYLDISCAGYGGNLKEAPLYVAVQEWDYCFEITYLMLYAFQGPQTACWRLSRRPYDCLIDDLGRHQGDLEWVCVTLDKQRLEPTEIGLQAHGRVRTVDWAQCPRQAERPLVRVALHGHACALQGEADQVVHRRLGILNICDLYGSGGPVWHPQLRRVGLDEAGEPISEEVWVKFQGRLGRPLDNHFRSITRLDGAPPGAIPRLLGKLVRGLDRSGWLPPALCRAEGTAALGDPGRWFVHGTRPGGNPLRQCPY